VKHPAARSALPRTAHQPATEATIDGEMRLLKEAQSAGTDGNWQRALRLLDEYAVRFPSGRLADVRAVAHMTALCQLGQINSARSEAERFLARYPNSPFTDRVKRVCAVTAQP
jgi:outer membrane protein assembly factor BamD (BamD/ComL family)